MTNIPFNARWIQRGETVAGGNGCGDALHQLHFPKGLTVDDDGTLYIADYGNHRIVAWKSSEKIGQIVAGGKGKGNRLDQLYSPTHVLVNKQTSGAMASPV
jgi:NHL repeat